MCGMMAIGLIGGVVSAMGAIAQANAQAAALKSEAEWKQREAAVEQTRTAYEINQERRRTQAALGQMQVGYAASGIETSGGTPEQVGQSIVQEREMDVQNRRLEGQESVNKNRWEAKNLKQQAKAAKTAGMFSAASSMIGAFGNAFGGSSSGTSLSGAFNVGGGGGPVAQPAVAAMPPAPSISGGGTVAAPALNPYGTGFYVGDPRRRF